MFLKSITLRQFRNHRQLELSVQPGVNLFLGPNGAGKTNLIEALAVLATGTSPRGAEPETMVPWGEEGFSLRGEFLPHVTLRSSSKTGDEGSPSFEESDSSPSAQNDNVDGAPLVLEMKYRVGSTRSIRQNGGETVRLRDLLGKVPLVSFVPEDLSLVKGEPELRRKAVNMVLSQVDPGYAHELRRYGEALKSRNAALRQLADNQISEDALAPWDGAVMDAGLALCRKRSAFLADFSPRVARVHHRVSGGRESIRLEYRPSFAGPWDDDARDRWTQEFRRTRPQELALGSTMVGPHRDDVLFLLDGRPAKSFGSEGQKRTCAVAFKLAEIPFLQEKLGDKPICLLDDVLSELDAQRASHLLQELSRTGQCFVTMTGLESWPKDCDLPAAVYHVREGSVEHEPVPVAS